MAVLIDHLKADDVNMRVSAMRSLPVIAEALGPDRVRAELIPFINESTDDEDEVRDSKRIAYFCRLLKWQLRNDGDCDARSCTVDGKTMEAFIYTTHWVKGKC